MSGIKSFWEFLDDFFGARTLDTSAAQADPWVITDTSSGGTPTYAVVDGAATGEIAVAFDSATEAQNVCLSFGDTLCLDIDKIIEFECRVKMNQATPDSATSFAFGLTGDRNDAIDSVAQAALFRLIGASAAVLVESDDGTHDNDDVATGATLANAYKHFLISFANGTADVRFFVDGQPVATGTTFDMSAYTGSLQPFFQIQKTSDNNVDGFTLDYVKVRGRR